MGYIKTGANLVKEVRKTRGKEKMGPQAVLLLAPSKGLFLVGDAVCPDAWDGSVDCDASGAEVEHPSF